MGKEMAESQLRQLQKTVFIEQDNYFNINRHNVLDGAVRGINRKFFNFWDA